MTFLSPMAGLIGAAVCVPLLVAVYLLRLRRRPVRVSSVLFWEQAARDVQANVPLRWLRPSVLLFLQLLALASFLMALARPAIDAGSAPASRLIVLLDASASMAAPGAPDGETARTRLEEARARALEIVDRAMQSGVEGGVRIAVISFGAAPTLEAGFTRERGRIERAIEGVAQTDQPADLGAALRLVEAQVASPGDDAGVEGGARVVLVSDGAVEAPTGASIGGAEFAFVRVGPAPGAERDNIGIAQISARRDYEDPALVRLFARIVNAGAQGRDVALTLRAGADAVRAETVFVGPASEEGPGEAPVALEARVGGAATLTVSIARVDALAADNAAAVTIAPALRLRLLLVGPGGGAGGGPDPFLVRALEALDPQQFTRVTIEEYERRALEPGWLTQYSLAVFDRASPERAPVVPTLSFASVAGAPGVALDPADGGAGTVRIASWDRSHPAMRYVSLDTLVMRSPATVATAPGSGLRVRTLAQSEAGPVIALVEGGAAARLIVSFDLSASNWPVQVGFAVFLANATALLAPGATGAPGAWVSTAEPALVRVASGATEVRARGPLERTAQVREGQQEVSLGLLPLAGVYSVTGAAPGDETLAVNLANAGESAIATRDEPPRVGGGEAGRGMAAAAPREIWRWFVLLGFALATLEWLLQAWRLRR